ncbi:MAG: class I SAM-dependent methyltransferase [Smithellaceae bacterium]
MGRLADLIFFRNHRLCPRWMCFTFDNGLRRLVQNPDRIVRAYVRGGDTVLDVGPGIGYFTIPMAKIVGDRGRVIAVDIQQAMLDGIQKRAVRAQVADRVSLHLASPDSLNVTAKADFILAFWMAHEVPDQHRFFTQLRAVLKENGKFLLAEPGLHVSKKQFEAQIARAQKAGFLLHSRPGVNLSLAALFSAG